MECTTIAAVCPVRAEPAAGGPASNLHSGSDAAPVVQVALSREFAASFPLGKLTIAPSDHSLMVIRQTGEMKTIRPGADGRELGEPQEDWFQVTAALPRRIYLPRFDRVL